jgi:probable addiction module antidote protein
MNTMAKIKTRAHDAANYIQTDEDALFLLEAAFEDGDAGVIAEAIGAIARAKGMTEVADATGLSRESLYRALSANGNPTLSTTLQVLSVLGLRLTVAEHKTAA